MQQDLVQTQKPDVSVYLFTGFLEAGKTKFIQETLCDRRFNRGEKTLAEAQMKRMLEQTMGSPYRKAIEETADTVVEERRKAKAAIAAAKAKAAAEAAKAKKAAADAAKEKN